MSQLKTKFLENNAVTGAKLRLDNDQALRARNNANSADVDLFKLNTSDVLYFLSHPRSTANATNADDILTKKDLDAFREGLKPKQAVRVATTANTTLSGAQTIDGVSAIAGDRVLVWKQTDPTENGIYVVAAGAWSRATDFDSMSPNDEINGATVSAQEGTLYKGWQWVQYGTVTTIGTDAINFTYRTNLEITGSSTITVTGNTISVTAGSITTTELASSVDATSFLVAAGYTPTSGNITVGDTIQQALQKVEYKANNSATSAQQTFTLTGTNITNGYVDLTYVALTGSVHLIPAGGVPQIEGVDFTLSNPGGFTRVTFAGDLATGGNAALVATDVIYIKYLH